MYRTHNEWWGHWGEYTHCPMCIQPRPTEKYTMPTSQTKPMMENSPSATIHKVSDEKDGDIMLQLPGLSQTTGIHKIE